MPEHRARKHHQDRVAETLRLEIGTMIDGELVDPRIANCYVSEVSLTPAANRHVSMWPLTALSQTSSRPRKTRSRDLKLPRATSVMN